MVWTTFASLSSTFVISLIVTSHLSILNSSKLLLTMYVRHGASCRKPNCLGETPGRPGLLPTIFYFLFSYILLACGPLRHYQRIIPMFERYENASGKNTPKKFIHSLEREATPALQQLQSAWKEYVESLVKEWCLCTLTSGVFSAWVPFPH